MRLAIVIVSFQGRHWLTDCLNSCALYAPEALVYVVENGSHDGSVELIEQKFPSVILLPQSSNLGFAEGNNIDMQVALDAGAEAIFLLNQDAELTTGCLARLVNHLEQNPNLAAIQPAILLPSGAVNSLGNWFHYLGFGESGGDSLSIPEAMRQLPWLIKKSEPPYLSGAAILIRAQALKRVGLFDAKLYLYHEDLELSWRFRIAGWQLAVAADAQVIHHYEFSRSISKFFYMERNRYVVWLAYFKVSTLMLLAIPWLIVELLLMLPAAAGGWLGAKWRAWASLGRVATWRWIGERRQLIKSLRQISDRQLLHYASATIHAHQPGIGCWLTYYFFNPLSSLVWRLIYPLIRW